MKALTKSFKMRMRITGLNHLIGDELQSASPFMQFVARCTKPEEFPAIIHKDGTSRVQTVSKNDSPGFRKLLEDWYRLTGCPMLLNTSLNIKGQPMVNNIQDAQDFYLRYNVPVVT
jgi:carbamoyltransferase